MHYSFIDEVGKVSCTIWPVEGIELLLRVSHVGRVWHRLVEELWLRLSGEGIGILHVVHVGLPMDCCSLVVRVSEDTSLFCCFFSHELEVVCLSGSAAGFLPLIQFSSAGKGSRS